MKSNITFVLFAKDEEKRIAYTINNFINYGDVLVFDGGSTDKTREISEELGAKFVPRPNLNSVFVENEENFKVILDNISTEWIYWGYVDNLAPKTLLEKFVQISQENKYKYVVVPLFTYLWGEVKKPAHKGFVPCFFSKNFVTFKGNQIHGMGQFLGKDEEKLKLPKKHEFALQHFSLYDINKFVSGHLKYSQTEATLMYDRGEKFSTFKFFKSMFGYFFLYYRYGFKNGKKGLLVSLSYAFFRFMTYFHLFELENKLDIESIEKTYSKKKTEIIDNLNKNI